MASRKEKIQKRIAFRQRALDKLYDAYEAIASGRVKSYMIDDRQLTNHNLDELLEEIRTIENEIDEMEARLDGGGRRKAVGVIPVNW